MNAISPASPMVNAVEFADVSKTFLQNRSEIPALAGFSLVVGKGDLVALIGANGAGKTTAIRCLLGLARPGSGSIRVGGTPVRFGGAKTGLGYLPERFAPPAQLTGREYLLRVGSLLGLVRDIAPIDAALERVGLAAAADRRIGGYSKGMTQRLGLAHLLLAPRDCLVLDEPSSGLDPLGRRQIRELLAELKAAGQTIVVSTHALADVEALADRIVLLVGGRTRYAGTVGEFVARHGASGLEEAFLAEIRTPLSAGAQA